MKGQPKYSPELRERAVRLLLDRKGKREYQWATIFAVAPKIGSTRENPVPLGTPRPALQPLDTHTVLANSLDSHSACIWLSTVLLRA